MSEDEVVQIVRQHIESKFPLTCSKCGHTFSSLKDYLTQTTHVGHPVSYDAEIEDWRPRNPLGTISFANCRCGTTLSISSQGMGLLTIWRLMRWARTESHSRGVSMGELLNDLRKKIDRQVLNHD